MGWDPYEVWSTRVRGMRIGNNVSVAARTRTIDGRATLPEKKLRSSLVDTKRGRRAALVWFTLALAIVLGLNRAVMGLFEVDLISDVFGVMTPVARAVCVLLGGAALYCAVAMVSLARR